MEFLQNLVAIDFVFLTLVVVLAVVGAVNGFVNEVFGKAAIVAGVWAAVLFHGKLVPRVEAYVGVHLISVLLAFAAVFVVVFLVVKVVQLLVAKVTRAALFSQLDHVLGFALGTLEGLALVAVVVIVARAQSVFDTTSLLEDSTFVRILEPLVTNPMQNLPSGDVIPLLESVGD